MFMLLADATGVTTTTTAGFLYYLEVIERLIVSIMALAGVFLFIFKGRTGYTFLKQLAKKLDAVATKSDMLMDKIVPRILQGFEKKGFVAENTLVEWTEIISANSFTTHSPKKLNDIGEKILTESSIKQIIDNNKKVFFGDLDALKLKTALDVEEKAFYAIDKRKEDTLFNPLKTYIYNNPGTDVYTCLFVGSLYLRDLYLAAHPDLK